MQTELLGKKGKERKPPLKEEAVPSMFSYAPMKRKSVKLVWIEQVVELNGRWVYRTTRIRKFREKKKEISIS